MVLHVSSEGPDYLDGERLECALSDVRRRGSALLAMAAGQSTNTLLKLSDWRGIPVRDMYPIARSAVESYVNAAFLLAEGDFVAQRAIDHVSFVPVRQSNRTVGKGAQTIKLASDPAGTVERDFPEFAGKGRRDWTSLSIADRIERIAKLGSTKGASRVLAAYALIYDISSEIIHGSVAGVSYFYNAHLSEPTPAAFSRGTAQQVLDILIAVSHAAAGFLATFFDRHSFGPGQRQEQALFDRLYAAVINI